jgi:hypothetical protein
MTKFSKAWAYCGKQSSRRTRAKLKRQIRRKHRRTQTDSPRWDERLVN